MTPSEARVPEHNNPSDFELWFEHDGIVRVRSGITITELTTAEARDTGHALIEPADAIDRD